MSAKSLERRIGKREAFRTLEEAALLGLLRTSDRVQHRASKLLRQHGLTSAQYNVLRILRGEAKPTPILEVAARMLTTTPGITGLIDRLEKLEMVRRRRCEVDRRVIFVETTDKALELLAAIDGPMEALRGEVFAHLGEANLRSLVRLLDRVREPLEEDSNTNSKAKTKKGATQ